jgi:hypothetical protein
MRMLVRGYRPASPGILALSNGTENRTLEAVFLEWMKRLGKYIQLDGDDREYAHQNSLESEGFIRPFWKYTRALVKDLLGYSKVSILALLNCGHEIAKAIDYIRRYVYSPLQSMTLCRPLIQAREVATNSMGLIEASSKR